MGYFEQKDSNINIIYVKANEENLFPFHPDVNIFL